MRYAVTSGGGGGDIVQTWTKWVLYPSSSNEPNPVILTMTKQARCQIKADE